MIQDPTAEQFERWIAAFRAPLVGLLASWGADWRSAEEHAQDVFAQGWLSRARFSGDPEHLESVGAWLRGIAFRVHSAAQRRAGPRAMASIEGLDPPAPTSETDERYTQLTRAFAQLGSVHQVILRMHYLDETSAREVAALLCITPKAVEDRLYQARKALRELVERDARRTAQGVRT